MKNEKGFSLIELLIVVAIILIIAAIAVPNLLKSKMAANEASAAAALRTIATSNVTFSSTFNSGFSPTLAAMGPGSGPPDTSTNANLIDSVLAQDPATKSGYKFTYTADPATPPATTFTVSATPIGPGSSGVSTFCIDQSNVVYKNPVGDTSAPAAPALCNSVYTGTAAGTPGGPL